LSGLTGGTTVDLELHRSDTDGVWLVWMAVSGLVVFLTFAPMFDAPRRGGSAWTWIVAGILLGPLSAIGYYTSRRGVRMAAERNAEAGGRRG
jgi:hypothetical protein